MSRFSYIFILIGYCLLAIGCGSPSTSDADSVENELLTDLRDNIVSKMGANEFGASYTADYYKDSSAAIIYMGIESGTTPNVVTKIVVHEIQHIIQQGYINEDIPLVATSVPETATFNFLVFGATSENGLSELEDQIRPVINRRFNFSSFNMQVPIYIVIYPGVGIGTAANEVADTILNLIYPSSSTIPDNTSLANSFGWLVEGNAEYYALEYMRDNEGFPNELASEISKVSSKISELPDNQRNIENYNDERMLNGVEETEIGLLAIHYIRTQLGKTHQDIENISKRIAAIGREEAFSNNIQNYEEFVTNFNTYLQTL